MVRLLIITSLLLPIQLCANEIYQSKDDNGRAVFSDEPTIDGSHDVINIEIQNDYDWHNPELNLRKSRKTKSKKKRRKKKQKTYTFAQLQSKCSKARYSYQNYRGTNNSSDWGSYKSKIINYAERRDYWCSRALKRK